MNWRLKGSVQHLKYRPRIPGSRFKLSTEEAQEIVEARKAGVSDEALARKYQVSEATIRSAAQRAFLLRPSKP